VILHPPGDLDRLRAQGLDLPGVLRRFRVEALLALAGQVDRAIDRADLVLSPVFVARLRAQPRTGSQTG